jgi:hypothetical protein
MQQLAVNKKMIAILEARDAVDILQHRRTEVYSFYTWTARTLECFGHYLLVCLLVAYTSMNICIRELIDLRWFETQLWNNPSLRTFSLDWTTKKAVDTIALQIEEVHYIEIKGHRFQDIFSNCVIRNVDNYESIALSLLDIFLREFPPQTYPFMNIGFSGTPKVFGGESNCSIVGLAADDPSVCEDIASSSSCRARVADGCATLRHMRLYLLTSIAVNTKHLPPSF